LIRLFSYFGFRVSQPLAGMSDIFFAHLQMSLYVSYFYYGTELEIPRKIAKCDAGAGAGG